MIIILALFSKRKRKGKMTEKEHGGKEKAAKRKVKYKCPKLDECDPKA